MFTTLGNAVFALLFTISTLATIILFAGFGSGLGVIYLVVSLLLALVWNSNRKSIGKDERELKPHHISKNIVISNISKACSEVLYLLGNQNSNPLSYGIVSWFMQHSMDKRKK